MNITAGISRLTATLASIVLVMCSLTSCDSMIYDDVEECEVTYRLRFRYDMNMKFADAFPHEVKSVSLYAFNPEGELVWQTTDSGQHLAQEGYEIILPLDPGKYKLLAWCGLENGESFFVPEITRGDESEALHCKLTRSESEEEGAISDDDLKPLFHGTLEVTLPDNSYPGDYSYTMYLTKDTNVFRIVLQHLSGEDLDVNDFSFKIEDNNGWLNYDNSLRDDENITYRAWSKYSGSAGVETDTRSLSVHIDSGLEETLGTRAAITQVNVAVAELTVSRLVMRDWSVEKKPILTIRKTKDDSVVARIPVIDYALLVKGQYNAAMSDQEYLDRQDEYNMTFFLDDNNNWLASKVIINSWVVVLNPSDLN